jgi:hypothetical protein
MRKTVTHCSTYKDDSQEPVGFEEWDALVGDEWEGGKTVTWRYSLPSCLLKRTLAETSAPTSCHHSPFRTVQTV